MFGEHIMDCDTEIKVSFGYQCNPELSIDIPAKNGDLPGKGLKRNSSSFSCLSGAALSANATLANTNIANGFFEEEILPTWDSPNSFRRIPSSPSMSKLDVMPSSLHSCLSNLSCSPSTPNEYGKFMLTSMCDPARSESFLNATVVQAAGGAAGEDRVQAVCSEENGWLFCAIYDGFNGRDAADFLAGTFYETIGCNLNLLNEMSPHAVNEFESGIMKTTFVCPAGKASFRQNVLDSLERSLYQTENDFLNMVEQEMDVRPDLVSVGSCVLVVLLIGKDLYTLSLGDSRALVATYGGDGGMNEKKLQSIQLTGSHTVDNEVEKTQLIKDHPDDPAVIVSGRVKGKLKVTRAFGVGYLKKKILNDALMGILRVQNLLSPPYISVQPSLNVHSISSSDQFVVIASDGLFDFFNNDEVVNLVHSYIFDNPTGDPAMFLLEKLVSRAADSAGFSPEELMSVPAGRRRKYHDDVTVMVINLGTNKRTSKASTCV